jgi:hypothetical protein
LVFSAFSGHVSNDAQVGGAATLVTGPAADKVDIDFGLRVLQIPAPDGAAISLSINLDAGGSIRGQAGYPVFEEAR